MSLIDIIRQSKNGGCIALGVADDAISALHGNGRYDLVLFASREDKPPPIALDDLKHRQVRILHAPLEDGPPLGISSLLILNQAADLVRRSFEKDRRILITSAGGRNRCALIAALALDKRYGCGGVEALREVRSRRTRSEQPALVNPHFVTLLEGIPRRPNGALRLDREAA
jgi:hypothetical protein